MTLAGRTRDRKHGERPKRRDSRNSSSPPSQGEGNRIWRGASSPSPRLPSGRLRPSELAIGPAEGGTRWTGYGEGRGEGASPQAQTRGEAPSLGAQERADLSPQAGRGKRRGQMPLPRAPEAGGRTA